MKQDLFYSLADATQGSLPANEEILLGFTGEDSDFCRLNKGKVRQIGKVIHDRLGIRLLSEGRHATCDLTLSGHRADDQKQINAAVGRLRDLLPFLPKDPYFLQNQDVKSSENRKPDRLPALEQWTDQIRKSSEDLDLVGIYAAGGIYRGFANSRGQRNWYESHSFNFDWSLYHETDKAVKSNYAGFDWENKALESKIDDCRIQHGYLKNSSITIKPGRYRVFLTPTALSEVLSLLSWRSFGVKGQRTKSSPLRKLTEGAQKLAAGIHLTEDVAGGVAPNFDSYGFIKPDQVPLISAGLHAGSLVSARSSREYNLAPTGAHESEYPESLALAGGNLASSSIMSELDEGLLISNLWYTNFSDLESCRMTGMTRFATFWVKNGKIQGPVQVMRFDESLYRMLGDNLLGLTVETEMLLSSGTYDARSTESTRLPGALISDFTFTL